MALSPEVREHVRARGDCAGEFCGVTETDAGGPMTVEHYRPRAADGDDDPDNLVYCCTHCNQYKADYWPTKPENPSLWHPRREPAERHVVLTEDGTLRPLTATGEFTIRRLRLNRPPLVAHRLRKQREAEADRLLRKYRGTLVLLADMQQEHTGLMEEHRSLLREQRRLLKLFLGEEP
ncbi:MAG: hypothetical protein COW34_13645 [Armatimonadetes bacterium CG17_big_fil_post_rev_8_21_14_2_50_66_6]|nr:MAG: hypothetical protein COW34_13645 [Armatimonadetes bacterium CG17_big_fil_post_rev_8_21_14_2_50_66_6]